MPFLTPQNFAQTIRTVREHVYGDQWEGPPGTYHEVLERRKTCTGRTAIAYVFGPNNGRSTCRGPGYMLHEVQPLTDELERGHQMHRVPEAELPIRTIEERLARILAHYTAHEGHDIVVVYTAAGVTLPYVVYEIEDPEIQALCERMLRERRQDEELVQKYLAEYEIKRSAFLPPKWSATVPAEAGVYRFRRVGAEDEMSRVDVVECDGQLQFLYYGRPLKHLWKYEFSPFFRDLESEERIKECN